jgi:hypothetical protein
MSSNPSTEKKKKEKEKNRKQKQQQQQKRPIRSQVWWHTPAIPILERLR